MQLLGYFTNRIAFHETSLSYGGVAECQDLKVIPAL